MDSFLQMAEILKSIRLAVRAVEAGLSIADIAYLCSVRKRSIKAYLKTAVRIRVIRRFTVFFNGDFLSLGFR